MLMSYVFYVGSIVKLINDKFEKGILILKNFVE